MLGPGFERTEFFFEQMGADVSVTAKVHGTGRVFFRIQLTVPEAREFAAKLAEQAEAISQAGRHLRLVGSRGEAK